MYNIYRLSVSTERCEDTVYVNYMGLYQRRDVNQVLSEQAEKKLEAIAD